MSLWRPYHSADYKFFDNNIREQFTAGATEVYVHKYMGPPISTTTSTDATKPTNTSLSPLNIQDLLFLENRDRKYDPDVYIMRAHYRIDDFDFELSQFGLFAFSDTKYMTFHLNDMVEIMGRKIMNGDVLEIPHLKDYYALDDNLDYALKRFFVVQDTNYAAEGFAPTWWPHLWRTKLNIMPESQEFSDILKNNKPKQPSMLDKLLGVNDAIVMQAENDVPLSGYDTSFIYHEPVNACGLLADPGALDASTVDDDTTDSFYHDASDHTLTSALKVEGYLTGNGLPPNANGPTVAGLAFPNRPNAGDYFLRTDYVPNRLFRFDGAKWVKIEDAVRTPLTPGIFNKTLKSGFINNPNARYRQGIGWDVIKVADPYTIPANSVTQSFSMSSKTVVTNIAFNADYGVRSSINNTIVGNSIFSSTLSNISNIGNIGNIGNLNTVSFTITNAPLNVDDMLEYTVYKIVLPEKQALSKALRPDADN